jgi:hypothetical protein
MICIQLFGGLGNQMFQYAFGTAIAKTLNTELVIDKFFVNTQSGDNKTTIRKYELNIFPNINESQATCEDIRRIIPLYVKLLNYVMYRMTGKGIRHSRYYIENGPFFDDKINRISSQCYLTGYWQSFKYQLNFEALIRNKFKFPAITDDVNLGFLQKIENVESVSIHIRRSDYLQAHNLEIHGVCSLDYYQAAIAYICQKIEKPVFFIFADDISWAMNNITIEKPHFYINCNKGNEGYRDMQLMASCKHNIIGNSSFSWWGAWLNDNPDKIVIAPAKWYNNVKDFTYSDLVPATWVSL